MDVKYLLPSEANGSRCKSRDCTNDKPLRSLDVSQVQPWCMVEARCLWKSLTVYMTFTTTIRLLNSTKKEDASELIHPR